METRQAPQTQPARPQHPHPGVPQAGQQTPYPNARNTKKWWVIAAVAAVVLIVGVVAAKVLIMRDGPKSDRYQAVFLDNGQAFFGKLKNVSGEYLIVENAYRAQSQQLPQDATEAQKQANANNVSLIKVGKEVYGPENVVRIRAEQVVFWQNLEPNSKVSKAIDNDKE